MVWGVEAPAPPSPEGRSRFDAALLFASVAAPMLVALSRASSFAEASHDAAVVRGLGLGFTGVFRALDVVVESLLLLLPVGTRALRAALGSALLGGVAGGLLYLLGRAAAFESGALRPGRAQGHRSSAVFAAAIAAASASFSMAWLSEASLAGSTLVGVCLVLAPLVLALLRPGRAAWPVLFGLATAAVTYEPLVGLVAWLSLLPALVLVSPASRARVPDEGEPLALRVAAGVALGALPFVVSLLFGLTSRYGHGTDLFRAWAGEGTPAGSLGPVELVRGQLGIVLPSLGALGAVLVLVDRRLWKSGGSLVLLLASSALAVRLGAPASLEHMSAPALILVASVALLAAVPMHAAVLAVGRARLPLAGASAAMVLLLLATFPVLLLDETLQKLDAKNPESARLWDDAAFEPLAPGSLVLVRDDQVYMRALASQATGELRADLTLVPTFDLPARVAEEELVRDPALAPVWRDLVLYGAPRERTLSTAASSRPLVMAFEPTLEKGILRHLVPEGVLASFHPEPRGASERLAALDRDALEPLEDAALGALTARLFDQRARALVALGEREAASRVEGASTALLLPTATGEHRPRRLLTPRGAHIATSP
jgi:hypothetical protein